ncbi:MAG TPA: hypothetical protein VGG62_12125 [Terracidiphilus sp.]|jgi:hypothetical protein
MRKPKVLADAFYDGQIERMSDLAGFPHAKKSQHELRRALRRISAVDETFLRRLVNEVVDSSTTCPTPQELATRALAMRTTNKKPIANAACPLCHGTGWIRGTRTVRPQGLAPYEADFSTRCTCPPVNAEVA